VCHTFIKREFETSDRSHNEWIVGLLAFGEVGITITMRFHAQPFMGFTGGSSISLATSSGHWNGLV
jgi:hypothetical protein